MEGCIGRGTGEIMMLKMRIMVEYLL